MSGMLPVKVILRGLAICTVGYLLSFSFLASEACARDKPAASTLIVKGSHTVVDGVQRLAFEVENKGDEAVTLYQYQLPWAATTSVILKAIRANALGDELQPRLLVEDPTTVVVEVRPGKKVAGHIDLEDRFPGLSKALETHDIIVFWSYQVTPVRTEPLERTGGWFVIRRKEKK